MGLGQDSVIHASGPGPAEMHCQWAPARSRAAQLAEQALPSEPEPAAEPGLIQARCPGFRSACRATARPGWIAACAARTLAQTAAGTTLKQPWQQSPNRQLHNRKMRLEGHSKRRKGVNHRAVLPQCSTWWNQKGGQARGFVSGNGAGLRCDRGRPPMSKRESDQKTVKGSHQRGSPGQS